jgi:hypothetical protein
MRHCEQVMLDVEKDRSAAAEFARLGGQGVPFFHAKATGKTASGWRSSAGSLDWLTQTLG